MDSNTGGILGIFGFLISMGGAVYAAVNHKKIRCRCCGRDLDVSVDVDSTEPVPPVEEEEATESVLPQAQVPPPPKKKTSRTKIVPAPPAPPAAEDV